MERARIYNKLKKPLHILTAFAVIICTAFCVPQITFADTLTPYTLPVAEIGTKFGTTNNGNLIIYVPNKTSAYYRYGISTDSITCYVFSYTSTSPYHRYVIVPSEGQYVYHASGNNSMGTVHCTGTYEEIYYYEEFNLSDSTAVYSDNIPNFETKEDGLAACYGIINGDTGNIYNFETTVEVPSGSVAYIGIPSSGSLSLSAKTTMPMYTSIGSNTWSNVPQRVKQVSSLPDSTTTFPLAGSAIPNWTKTEPYNWLNQSKSAVTSTTSWSGSNGNFLTFYNPVYYMDGSIQASTNTVYLTISGYSSIRIYPLQNDMSITAGSTSTSPTDYDGYWDATITDNGDGTGSVSYNPSEGSNLPPTPTSNQYNTGTSSSIIDYINQINQTLTNFAESFINLLKAPVAHIQQLVSAGSDFVGQLSGLYSWLPAEVYNTLTSAIILCISVGVLKVLL